MLLVIAVTSSPWLAESFAISTSSGVSSASVVGRDVEPLATKVEEEDLSPPTEATEARG